MQGETGRSIIIAEILNTFFLVNEDQIGKTH